MRIEHLEAVDKKITSKIAILITLGEVCEKMLPKVIRTKLIETIVKKPPQKIQFS